MNKIKSIISAIIFIVLFVWQLPQMLMGAGFFSYHAVKLDSENWRYKKALVLCRSLFSAGLSLGCFIFTPDHSEERIKHEYGHSIQSRIFGPLYLFVIGIPSAWWGIHCQNNLAADPYDFWTERWANKLGGV